MRTFKEILAELEDTLWQLKRDNEDHFYARALICMFGEWLGLEEGMAYQDAEDRCRHLISLEEREQVG
jgi:hypothetical protein